MEEWRSVIGYEGIYEVSNYGRVRSVDREVKQSNGSIGHYKGKILKGEYDKKGYRRYRLSKNNKTQKKFEHQLVAQAFIPNPNNYSMINHKDEIKDNNHVSNLEWCDSKYNNNYGTIKQRISEAKKKKIICITDGKRFNSVNEAAEFYGIGRRLISGVLSGSKKTTYGKTFRYLKEGD